jgi:glycosyltransferase involved in cell wall biosynthesis
VLTSLHEAAGVVLLEAACTGLPIAGSAVGYLADWSPDRAAGVPPGDPVLLAAAIEALLRDPKRRHEMGLARQRGLANTIADVDRSGVRGSV